MGNYLTSWEVDRSGCHVPDYDRDLLAARFHVSISLCNINPIQ